VSDALSGDSWVADGNYGAVRDIVWGRAETLVWLDYPLGLALLRLARRTTRRVWTGEVLWNGNREDFRGAFASRDSLFLWAARSHSRRRRTYPALLAQPEYSHLHTVRLTSRPLERAWLARLTAQHR